MKATIIGKYKGTLFEVESDRFYREDFIPVEGDGRAPLEFNWGEGNWSCDCNRSAVMPEWIKFDLGKDPDDDDPYFHAPCGQNIMIDEIRPEDNGLGSIMLGENRRDGHYSRVRSPEDDAEFMKRFALPAPIALSEDDRIRTVITPIIRY